MEISTDITERKQVERSQRLLAEAGPVLAASLDATSRLANIAQVVVPLLADWCMVHITEEGQPIQPVAVAHADPQKLAQADDLLRRILSIPPDPDAPPGAVHVLRTGRPEFYPNHQRNRSPPLPGTPSSSSSCGRWGQVGMIVPLVTRGHTLGTITLVVSAESGRQYTEVDLALAEELARRAALAVDNARLYAEAQQLNAELEERVVERTAELQAAIAQLENSRAQLLLLAHHEQTRREEDRTRMAREIHDELGQALTGLKMDLAWLQKHTRPDRRTCCRNSETCPTWWTPPSRMCGASPPSCVRACWMTWDWCRRWSGSCRSSRSALGSAARFTSDLEEVALDAEETTVLFRILQETLTNVARHAAATQVEVSLDEEQGYVRLRVQDNGRGITEGEVEGSRSFGLLGMRERVLLRSGDFSIQGTPGQGTTVVIKLPRSKGAGGAMIRALIADDHAVVRQGLKQILGDTPEMVVAGEATNGQEVLDKVRAETWDVVILDISMPDRSGLDILKQLRSERPKLPVLVLSMHSEDQYAMRVLKAGASGYLTKDSAPDELVKAIRKVVSGGRYVSSFLAEKLAFEIGTDSSSCPTRPCPTGSSRCCA